MAELEQIIAHEEHAQGLLIDQYQERPRITALLAAYTVEIQAAEDMLWDVRVKRFIDNAEGQQLDVIGAIVGEIRNGRADELYRPLLLVRIALNKSDGRPDDVIGCLRLLSNTPFASNAPIVFRFEDYYPASFDVDVHEFTPGVDAADAAEILAHVVRSSRAAGVHGSVLITSFQGSPTDAPDAYMTYDDEAEAVADANAEETLMSYSDEDSAGPMAGVYE